MSPVSAPADRRFRRAHVKPSRRRSAWRAAALATLKYALLVTVGAYAIYRGGLVVAQARMLKVDQILIEGNTRLSQGEVLAVLTGLRGENIVRTDLAAWRRRLMSSPWVRDAALRRSLPSTVEVMVWERAPIGIGRIKGDLYLVDEHGVVIDDYGPNYADLDLPIIDGLSASAGDGAPDEARAELAGRLIASLTPQPSVARRLSQVDVSDLRNASVILSGDSAVIHIGDDRFLQRLQSYVDLSDALRSRVPEIDYVDLRFEDRIYVRPTGKVAKRPAARSAR